MFKKFIYYLFPVQREEISFVSKASLILFFSILNNSLVSNIKETLIETTEGAGVEITPYLNGIFVPILTVLFFAFYKKINVYFKSMVFLCFIYFIFLFYFLLFSFFVDFNLEKNSYNFNSSSYLDERIQSFIYIFKNILSISIFYVISELWGIVTISLIFWQVINNIIKKKTQNEFIPY